MEDGSAVTFSAVASTKPPGSSFNSCCILQAAFFLQQAVHDLRGPVSIKIRYLPPRDLNVGIFPQRVVKPLPALLGRRGAGNAFQFNNPAAAAQMTCQCPGDHATFVQAIERRRSTRSQRNGQERFDMLTIMSSVMDVRSYSGAQPHSSRAVLSSRLFGQESAIPWRSGSMS